MNINILIIGLIIVVLLGVALAVKIVKQYEQGVLSGWAGRWARAHPCCG
jgi:regulator of protease activity HflC (stomatin/prohibitin superfamily)